MSGQKFLRLSATLAIALAILHPRSSEAQVLYGSVVGTVQDPSGAGVPDAALTITNSDTGQTRDTKADSQGNYNMTNVLPGRYELRVTATGFRTVTQKNLDVTAGNATRSDLRLEVGQLTESVEVSAEA